MKTVKYYYSKAVHLRKLPVVTDEEGNALFLYEKSEPLIKKLPRITVASVYDPINNSMKFGVAVCSPKDTFKKSIGRELALKRAQESASVVIVKYNKVREVSTRYANELIDRYLSKYVRIKL